MLVGIVVIGLMFVNMALALFISKMDNASSRETARKVLIGVNLILVIGALTYAFLTLGPGA